MTTQEVLSKLTDEDIEKMKACANQEEVYAYLQTKGLTDSFEDFKATVTEINEKYGKMSPEEIDAVAGGVDTWVAVAVDGGSAVLAIAGAAAYAAW